MKKDNNYVLNFQRAEEINDLANSVDGFSKEYELKLLNMNDKEFKEFKEGFIENVLTPNFNIK